jgi:hypothetical protein
LLGRGHLVVPEDARSYPVPSNRALTPGKVDVLHVATGESRTIDADRAHPPRQTRLFSLGSCGLLHAASSMLEQGDARKEDLG